MLASTYSVRAKLQALFEEKELSFFNNNEFESDEDALRVWNRYVINLGIELKNKRSAINIRSRTGDWMAIPKDLAEKILILNTAPPLPPIYTLKDLVVRKLVKEYRIGIHNICVASEAITDKYLLLFHDQTDCEDYKVKKKHLNNSEICLSLDYKVLEIKKNEAKVETRLGCIFLKYKNEII